LRNTPALSANALYSNRGKGFESLLDMAHMVYTNQGVALIKKVEIPKIWDRKAGIMKYAAKTGFDYEGVFCGTGRFIAIEAKESKKSNLYVDLKGKSGLKIHQIEAIIKYGQANAFSGVLWSNLAVDTIFFLDWVFLKDFMEHKYNKDKHRGRPVKSIMLHHVTDVCPSFTGTNIPDYLNALEGK